MGWFDQWDGESRSRHASVGTVWEVSQVDGMGGTSVACLIAQLHTPTRHARTHARTCWIVCARARCCLWWSSSSMCIRCTQKISAQSIFSWCDPSTCGPTTHQKQLYSSTRTHFPIPCTAAAVAATPRASVGAPGSCSAAKPSPTCLLGEARMRVCVCVCVHVNGSVA